MRFEGIDSFKKYNFCFDWPLALTGLEMEFIDLKVVEEAAYSGLFCETPDEDLLVDIAVNNDTNEYIVQLIKDKIISASGESSIDEIIGIAREKWMHKQLKEILDSNLDIEEMLDAIERIWLTYDCPDSIESFISAMPPAYSNPHSMINILQSLAKYLDHPWSAPVIPESPQEHYPKPKLTAFERLLNKMFG